MAVNLVVIDGTIKGLSLKYDSQGKPEARWTLVQTEKDWPLYLPCLAVGSTAERLASEIEDRQHVLVTSGKLVYRKRMSKQGTEHSRLEILVWSAEVLSGSPQDERNEPGEGDSMSAGAIVEPEPTERTRAPKARRPRYAGQHP